jgi:ribosomal protein L13
MIDFTASVLRMSFPEQITRVIMGKHKPIYDPSFVVGDFVVVVNADK